LVALFSTTDRAHARAAEIVGQIARGSHGQALMTDRILEETLNYMVAKSRDPRRPEMVARDLLGEGADPWLDLARVDGPTWDLARDRFRLLSRAGLSFTDCTSIAFCQRNAIPSIASFDSGFDAFLARLH
jgi:predicted nucleic acid-binding protein